MLSTRPLRPIALAATAAIAMVACGSDEDLTARQQAVAEAGADVMPFDLDATTHIFTDTDTGGTQDVVADDPDDDTNIVASRRHLADEAAKFRAGDFSDPEAIHGPAMPGLAILKERYDDITVELAETPTGATITYTSSDPDVISAIHDWFAAQTSDHGTHAEHGST